MFGIEGLLATTTSSERTNSRTIGWRAPWAWAQRKSSLVVRIAARLPRSL